MTNAFHENLLSALAAKGSLNQYESVVELKNDSERKKWLKERHPADIVNAAMLLTHDSVVEAYDVLWKLVRPHGRDDKFYVEGKGE